MLIYSFSCQGKLVKVQEVAVWSNPGVSLAWVLVTQAGLFYVTSVTSTSLVSGLAYTLLRFKREEQKN